MLKISIPTPCHEDWNKMDPNAQGRHCNSCMKTVVDFTAMSDDEVQHFLINKKQEHVCGRFTEQQLQTIRVELPANIFVIRMPLWKQFLVASLIVFGTTLFSCEVKHPDPTVKARISGSILGTKASGSSLKYPEYRGIMLGGIVSRTEYQVIEPTIDSAIIGYAVPMIPDTTLPVLLGDINIEEVDSTGNIIHTKIICTPVDTMIQPHYQGTKKGEVKFTPDSIKTKKDDPSNCEHFS